MNVELVSIDAEEAQIRVDGRLYFVPYVLRGSTVNFHFDGEIYFVEVADKSARGRTRHRDHSMEAPMPGLVTKILVKAGDVVAKGTPLLILEAMKMEHQIVAPRDGTIAAIHCTEGEMVQPGVELVTMEPVSSREK
jgi:3-methylcrotonyl-CoA carboxylase alpha subunit